jgi:hypothetical protein
MARQIRIQKSKSTRFASVANCDCFIASGCRHGNFSGPRFSSRER